MTQADFILGENTHGQTRLGTSKVHTLEGL